MLCMAAPCECNKPARAPKTRKKADAQPHVEVETLPTPTPKRSSVKDAMRAAAAAAPVVSLADRRAVAPVAKKPIVRETPIEDLLFADALRNLSPIRHWTELDKYRVLLTTVPSAKDRARLWRYRREEGKEDG